MAAASRRGDLSTGHGCFPPTACISASASRTFINGILAQKQGSRFNSHRCGKVTHAGSQRATSSGSSTVFIEGARAVRIGDSIACGDAVAQGSPNVQIGG
jgi:uncharacterized Zn-binding protein involved in type VI secretion